MTLLPRECVTSLQGDCESRVSKTWSLRNVFTMLALTTVNVAKENLFKSVIVRWRQTGQTIEARTFFGTPRPMQSRRQMCQCSTKETRFQQVCNQAYLNRQAFICNTYCYGIERGDKSRRCSIHPDTFSVSLPLYVFISSSCLIQD